MDSQPKVSRKDQARRDITVGLQLLRVMPHEHPEELLVLKRARPAYARNCMKLAKAALEVHHQVKAVEAKTRKHEPPKDKVPTAVGNPTLASLSGPNGRAREQRPRRRAGAASRSPDGDSDGSDGSHLAPTGPDWLPGHGDVELCPAPFAPIPLEDWFISMFLPELGGASA